MTKITSAGDLQSIAKAYNDAKAGFSHHIYTCGGGACVSSGCIATRDAAAEYLKEKNLTKTCGATFTGCMGLCSLGPVMIVEPEGTFYIHVTPEKAREIIDREYGDVQLGLASIADRLGISQPYLSRVFKEEYSEGISTVLNRRRIEAAKELMLAGDGNLKEIAAKVGFTSDMNFIRVFKKFETVTPGVYRKDAKQDKS